tara:strand:+ start:8272 stop:8562 length:291 start_codon:yes stop_codon:yes gene_type:complete
MTKIVYNACYGGFGLSNEAIVRYAEIKGLGPVAKRKRIERNDPALVQVVEELGDKANGGCAELRIIDIPAGTLYRIDEYDGAESVMTQDDYDWKVA